MWGKHDILAVAVASSRMSGAREPVTVTVNWHPSKVERGGKEGEGGKGNGGQLAQARKRFALLFAFQSNKAKKIGVNWQITHKQRDAQQQQQLPPFIPLSVYLSCCPTPLRPAVMGEN